MIQLSTPKIITIAAVAIVAIVSLIYFYGVRIPDSNYVTAKNTSSSLINSADTITANIEKLKVPLAIKSEDFENFSLATTEFSEKIITLDREAVIQRDPSVNAEYKKVKQQLVNFAQSMQNISDSIALYRSIMGVCGEIGQNGNISPADFDNATASCRAYINDDTLAKSEAFNTQFLDKYKSYMIEYVNSQKQLSAAGTNITLQNSANEIASQTAAKITTAAIEPIEYDSFVDPTDSLKKLLSSIESRAASFLR